MYEDLVATIGPGPGGTGTNSVRSYRFYLDTTIQAPGTYAANAYTFIDTDTTNFLSHTLQYTNEGGVDIWFSFDGATDHGRIKGGEPITQDYRREKKVWFRGVAGTAFRFWAY